MRRSFDNPAGRRVRTGDVRRASTGETIVTSIAPIVAADVPFPGYPGSTSPGDDPVLIDPYPFPVDPGYPTVPATDPRTANAAATLSTGWVLRHDRSL
jgi:hypothetical protein